MIGRAIISRAIGRASALVCLMALAAGPPAPRLLHAQPGAFPGVPADELAGYEILYQLVIPATGPGYHNAPVPYQVDRVAELEGHFDRIAYHLRLEATGASEPRMVWASMAAFTSDSRQLGVPTAPLGVAFQREVADLHVYSNVTGLPRGADLGPANIEMWPHNYTPANGAAVPGASSAVFDTGDDPTEPVAGYGSFQVHHQGSSTTLLAWNRWGFAGATDLGIGNSSGEHSDWTFLANSANYLRRTLTVLVRPAPEPSLRIEQPLPRSVHQRDDRNRAGINVEGWARANVSEIEARGIPLAPGGEATGPATPWQDIGTPTDSRIAGRLDLPAGWYAIELRATGASGEIDRQTVRPIGVGEVFVTAGQSNSANHGLPPLAPVDPRVSARGLDGWRRAGDPQPIATGTGGSPWPPLGDALAAALDVPIGFVSVGWGGTRVDQWLPGGTLYPRLRDALDGLRPTGARAVLWHQGESDALAGTTTEDYVERLQTIIEVARLDTGFAMPWGIARASFLPGLAPEVMAAVIAGQDIVIAADPLVFAGPPTDDLLGTQWRHDAVHFNEAGLREHAARWERVVLAWMEAEGLLPTPGQPNLPEPTATTAAEPATPEPSPRASATTVITKGPDPLWLPHLLDLDDGR